MAVMLKEKESVVLGEGDFRYRVEDDWARLPAGWAFGEVAAVAVDKRDHVYVFSRGAHPMTIFDRDGNFLRSWGEDIFKRAHGLHAADDDTIFCTDDGDHTVRRCTLDGKVLLEIGVPGQPSRYMSGKPFNRCTHTALSPTGDIYVSDGYGNACVHKYSPDGKLLLSWGSPGTEPGQFNLPHNICCDEDGWVYIADRENHRVQVFDGKGGYEAQWNNLHRPSAIFMRGARCSCPYCYIGECGPVLPINRKAPNMGPRLSIVTKKDGKVVAKLGDRDEQNWPGQFISPHGIAVDSRGDIYVGEVSRTAWPSLYPDQPAPDRLRVLQKLVKI
jgi:DNA-binding beta-propeller fold protein YncE